MYLLPKDILFKLVADSTELEALHSSRMGYWLNYDNAIRKYKKRYNIKTMDEFILKKMSPFKVTEEKETQMDIVLEKPKDDLPRLWIDDVFVKLSRVENANMRLIYFLE